MSDVGKSGAIVAESEVEFKGRCASIGTTIKVGTSLLGRLDFNQLPLGFVVQPATSREKAKNRLTLRVGAAIIAA